jgi:hypothetical protein
MPANFQTALVYRKAGKCFGIYMLINPWSKLIPPVLFVPLSLILRVTAEVGSSNRIPIFRYSDCYRTKAQLSEYPTNISIGLQLSE